MTILKGKKEKGGKSQNKTNKAVIKQGAKKDEKNNTKTIMIVKETKLTNFWKKKKKEEERTKMLRTKSWVVKIIGQDDLGQEVSCKSYQERGKWK